MGYYNKRDIIYKIGTAEFRKLCLLGMTAFEKIKAVDKALNEKGISTKGWGPEDYEKAIEALGAKSYYGIEFDTTIASPLCTRIGDMQLHRTLPVHSKMRGCLLADDGTVVKYLNSADWSAETLDGSQGQVMVEVPEHWMRFETDGNKRRVYVSETEIDSFIRVPRYYVSAYEAAWDRTNDILCSVVNNTPQFRGGNNQSDWDNLSKTLLGRPVSNKNREEFRLAARRRNPGDTRWNCLTYEIYKDLFWLYYIEFANLNCQAPYTGERDANGYRQGGLGPGVTTLNSTYWNTFNGYSPFIPCGITNSLGNNTGVIPYQMPDEYNPNATTPVVVNVPRYRGVENPFGHIGQWTDGINVRISPNVENGGDRLSKVFVCTDPAKFSDSGYDGYAHVGNEARAEGYVKEVIFGEGGEITPSVVGGSSSTYFCDYHYINIPKTEALRGVLFGGNATDGAAAGFAFATSHYAPSYMSVLIGSRLCFIPV